MTATRSTSWSSMTQRPFQVFRSSRKAKTSPSGTTVCLPRRRHSGQALEDVRDLTKPIQEELERFFVATDELEDKKLDIVGWKGPKAAM
jgi:inorganic pyrophosphatase